jgi:hypothetical protein
MGMSESPIEHKSWIELLSAGLRMLATPTKIPSRHDILFVASPADITMPIPTGMASQYLHTIHLATEEMGLTSITVLRPNTGRVRGGSHYKIFSFPRIRTIVLFRMLFQLLVPGYKNAGNLWLELRERVRTNSPRWSDLLDQIKPKLVIGIGLTDELCDSARRASIPTIEVQHGFFEEMPAYWKQFLPDYFFCWDALTAEKASAAGLVPVISGHPFEHLANLRPLEPRMPFPSVCCVCLSWGDPNSIDTFGSLSPIVFETAKKLQSCGVKLVLRLHPVMSRLSILKSKTYANEIRRLLPGAIIQNPAQVSLQEAISSCNFALTDSSSTAFDFAILGKITLVANDQARSALSAALARYGLRSGTILSCSEESIRAARWIRARKIKRQAKPPVLPLLLEGILIRSAP